MNERQFQKSISDDLNTIVRLENERLKAAAAQRRCQCCAGAGEVPTLTYNGSAFGRPEVYVQCYFCCGTGRK